MRTVAVAKRLRALEQRERAQLPSTALIVVGSSSADIAAQHARAVAEGRAKPGEPFISIKLLDCQPSVRRADSANSLSDAELEAIAGAGFHGPAAQKLNDAELFNALVGGAP